ncbi:hypothetical protein RhiirB3_456626 [Rhizophagus irregularis]|nr:hypothetical protein RhiirB3_456626 [Rhizophagus irregularis]
MINKKWENHIRKIRKLGAKKQNELINYIKKESTNHSKKNRYYILIGNLNSYMDKTLDYSGLSKLRRRPSNIIMWLDNAFFTDTYRKLNPKKRFCRLLQIL